MELLVHKDKLDKLVLREILVLKDHQVIRALMAMQVPQVVKDHKERKVFAAKMDLEEQKEVKELLVKRDPMEMQVNLVLLGH